MIDHNKLDYIPTEEEHEVCKEYFAEKERISTVGNLQLDEDDFFMEELAYTVRLIFLEELSKSDE